MDINATLIGQMITFVIFVAFTMKFVWPPLMKVLDQRRQKILEGLSAGEKGQQELETAKVKVRELILEARAQASIVVDQANQRAHQIEEEARSDGRNIVEKMKAAAEVEIEQARSAMLNDLRTQMADLAVLAAEKLIRKNLDKAANELLLKEFADQVK